MNNTTITINTQVMFLGICTLSGYFFGSWQAGLLIGLVTSFVVTILTEK